MNINSRYTILTFLGIILYFISIMFQGFDVCDEGFALSSYQQVFNAPSSIEYNMLFWLTSIIGGAWYTILPAGGILSFRILGAITIIATMLISRNILKPYIPNKHIIIALLMVMVSKGIGVVNFSYNTLSGFMSVLVLYYFFKGLINHKKAFVFLAGFCTGISAFASLPTITISALILLIPFYHIQCKQSSWKTSLRLMGYYCIGILVGILLTLTIMHLLGHLEIFRKALAMISHHSTESDSNHNIFFLVKKYIIDYVGVIKTGSILCVGTFILIIVQEQLSSKILTKICNVLIGIFYIFILIQNPIFTTYFICIASCTIVAFNKNRSSQIRLISFGALVTSIFLPIGTDPGIHSIGHTSIWIALPFFFFLLWDIKNIKLSYNNVYTNQFISICRNRLKSISIIFIIAFFVVKLYLIANGAYFDPGNRLYKTAKINSPLAQHVHTTPERAYICNIIISKLKEVVKPGEYLMVYDKMPMLHYLTNTKPYVYNPWIWAYDSFNFEQQLCRAESEIDILPIVLVHKFETIFSFSEPIDNYLDEDRSDTYLNRVKSHIALNSFLNRNNYRILYEDIYYTIYSSEKKHNED